MSRPCKACSAEPNVQKAINQRLRSGTTIIDVARYLDSIEQPIGRNALSRHLVHVGLGPRTSGPRPMSGDLAADIVARVTERMAEGELEPNIKDGLAASALLERRMERRLGEEWQLKLIQALTGHSPQIRVIDPELEATEAEFRKLLEAGETPVIDMEDA